MADTEERMSLRQILYMVGGILAIVGGIVATIRDTPERRAAIEAADYKNKGAQIALKIEELKTRQLELKLKAGVLQPQAASTPVNQEHFIKGEGKQFFLAEFRNYFMVGDGSASAGEIGFYNPPKVEGAVKLEGCGKVAWTESWSSEASPISVEELLRECSSTNGNYLYLAVTPRGKVSIIFV
jgi:hypothetical protein